MKRLLAGEPQSTLEVVDEELHGRRAHASDIVREAWQPSVVPERRQLSPGSCLVGSEERVAHGSHAGRDASAKEERHPVGAFLEQEAPMFAVSEAVEHQVLDPNVDRALARDDVGLDRADHAARELEGARKDVRNGGTRLLERGKGAWLERSVDLSTEDMRSDSPRLRTTFETIVTFNFSWAMTQTRKRASSGPRSSSGGSSRCGGQAGRSTNDGPALGSIPSLWRSFAIMS
jgi:hypothetical protein